MEFQPHSEKQSIIIHSEKRIVIAGVGIQWGKTISGVVWLKTMMHRFTNEDDNFLVCSPTYKILEQSTLPPFLMLNKGCGRMDRANMCFHIHGGGKVWFRTGQNPDSVVGITNVRAVLCDEVGLFSRYFWDNIQARASFMEAPIRLVTSPYSLNWLYTDFIRPYQKGDEYIKQLIDLVQATSKDNPYFPDKEYEDRRRTMDARRFNMIYGGQFDKAEGLVYDCFDQYAHQVDKINLPPGTKFYAGVDWGFRDPFVMIVRAVTPDGLHYDVGEFFKVGMTIDNMIDAASRYKALHNIERFYCDPSRPEYISLFNQHGLRALAAENDIRLGIDRHYELIKSGLYAVFRRSCPNLIDEYEQYHYPELKETKVDQVQKMELPVDKDNHTQDAVRYVTMATYKPLGKKRNKVVAHSENYGKKKIISPYYDNEIENLKKRKRKNYADIPL